MTVGWGELPPELLIMVMSFLDAKELARLGNVNYHWKRVGEDDSLWRPLFISDYKLSAHTQLKGTGRWVDEYKMLKYEAPIILCENLRDCNDGLTHVCFSPNGLLFSTTANDGSFKIWTATSPTYLVHERYLGESLLWERAVHSQFSPDSNFLLVCGVKFTGDGEIAIFSVDGEEGEVHFSCRVPNNPAELYGCWYDNTHIFCGETYHFGQNSIIGSSVSQIYLCSARSPTKCGEESVLTPVLRILNRGGGYCQMLQVGRHISPRFRAVILLGQGAVREGKSLSAMAHEMFEISEGESWSEETKRRMDEMCAQVETNCGECAAEHAGCTEGTSMCNCGCHDEDDRLLVYAVGDSDSRPPHAVAFKIISAEKILKRLKKNARCDNNDSSDDEARHADHGASADPLLAIMSMFQLPDHVIDVGAHVLGLALSADNRYLYVNVTHDHFDVNAAFDYLAEVRVIDLSTMTFETSYFGHLAKVNDRFGCSVGGHYLASASLEGARVWSKDHHRSVGALPHNGAAAAVAVDPPGEMVVSVGEADGRIKIWRSKKFLQKLCVPNDFM